MPVMDGYEACERIIKIIPNNKVTIIALTADATLINE